MSYNSIMEMTASMSLMQRIAACAAEEGYVGNPMGWVQGSIWQIVSEGNWDAAWDSARAAGSVNVNPDTGARDDVITDGMILSVVQPMVTQGN